MVGRSLKDECMTAGFTRQMLRKQFNWQNLPASDPAPAIVPAKMTYTEITRSVDWRAVNPKLLSTALMDGDEVEMYSLMIKAIILQDPKTNIIVDSDVGL